MILYTYDQQMKTNLLWISREGFAFMRKGSDVEGSAFFLPFPVLNRDTLLCTVGASYHEGKAKTQRPWYRGVTEPVPVASSSRRLTV